MSHGQQSFSCILGSPLRLSRRPQSPSLIGTADDPAPRRPCVGRPHYFFALIRNLMPIRAQKELPMLMPSGSSARSPRQSNLLPQADRYSHLRLSRQMIVMLSPSLASN